MLASPAIDWVKVTVVLLSMIVPGVALFAVLIGPRRFRPAATLGLTLAFGYAAVLTVGFVLALFQILNEATVVAAWVVLSATCLILGRRRLAEHVHSFVDTVRNDPLPFALGVLVVLSFAVARASFPPIMNLEPTAMRYWVDGVEIADAGGFPSAVLHWGRLLPPAMSKVGLNSFFAASSLLIGREAFPALGAMLFVLSVSIAIVGWGALDALGLRWTAPAAVLWLFANVVAGQLELTRDLARVLAEDWGRMLGLAMLTVATVALWRLAPVPDDRGGEHGARARRLEERGDRIRLGCVMGLLLGVAAVTHLVAAAAFLGIVGALALVTLAAERAPRRVLTVAAAGILTAAMVAGAALTLPPGELGFGGASGDAGYQSIRDRYGFAPSWDPVLYLTRGKVDQEVGRSEEPIDVWRLFLLRADSHNRSSPGVWPGLTLEVLMPFVLAAIGLLLTLFLGDRRLRIVVVSILLFAVLLVAVGIGFSIRYDVQALEQFARRRLTDYWGIPFVLLAAAGLETSLRRIGGISSTRATGGRHLPRKGRGAIPAIGGVLITVLVAGSLLPGLAPARRRVRERTSSLGAISWVADHVPCEGRILADRRTLATFELLTGHAGAIEGMGPHLRTDVLRIAVGEMLAAQRFFTEPSEEYLRSRGVAAVIITERKVKLGGWQQLTHGSELVRGLLDEAPFLDLAHSSKHARIYLVRGFKPDPDLPRVADAPGYRCEVTDI